MKKILQGVACLVVVATQSFTPVFAQGVPEAPSTTATDSMTQRTVVREVWPPIVYLMDDDGNPTIPWVDFPWDRYELAEGIVKPREQAKQILTELRLEVVAKKAKAVIEVTLRVRCLVDGAQLVPIEMGGCHFAKQPSTREDVAVFARFNEQIDEYELLLNGKKDQDFEVQFTLIAPIHAIGETTKLRLALPRVPVSSLRMTVPEEDLVGEIGDRMAFSTEESGGTTTFEVNGLLPNFEFSWRPRQQTTAEDRVAFEAEGNIEVQVDSRGMVTSDARFSISSLNLPIERFRVRLPANTRWSDTESDIADYSVIPFGNSESNRRELEIVLAQASLNPPTIRLQVQTERLSDVDESSFELAGFEIVDAASQYGQVSLYSDGDHQLSWKTGDYAQRIINRGGAKATFAYYQPNQIRLTISRQSREVMVEPLYLLTIAEDRATLNAIYRCNTGGANLSNLTIDLGPWTFDGLGKDPQNLIGDKFELRPDDGKIELPLTAVPNTFEIAIIATLVFDDTLNVLSQEGTIQPEDNAVDFRFPYPDSVDKLLPSTVAVLAKSDVVVAQRETSSYVAISMPQRVAEEIESNANPLCFRSRGGVPSELPLVAARLERSIAVTCDTDIIEIGSKNLRVRQRMRWEVEEVQLPRALLTMPKRVYESGNPQITINGNSTIHSRYPTFGDSFSDRLTVQIPLEPMIGAFEMTVTYDWSYWEPERMEAVDLGLVDPIFLDLVLPKKDSSTLAENMRYLNRLRRRRVAGYQVLLSTSGNAAMDFDWIASTEVGEPDIEASTEKLLPKVPLTVTQVEASIDTAQYEELVDRAWYQTWYTDSDRTDRAVFRVQGGDSTLRINLPNDTVFGKLHAWVDGLKSEFNREGAATIELNVDPSAPVHVVELRYAKATREPPGVLETQVPVIEGADILGQWYWHVVMPRNECLVSWPRSLTRAHQWDWEFLVPRVRPQLSQTELENWSGAMQVEANVLLGSTEYLFGAMGEPEKLSVRTAPLPIYVLAIAGAMLIFGLLLMHARPHQRIWVMCAAGSSIAALIFVHPSYGAIGGQAAVLGALLVAVAGLLSWLFKRAGRRSVFSIEPFSSVVTGRATQVNRGSSAMSPPTTTMSSTDPLQSSKAD